MDPDGWFSITYVLFCAIFIILGPTVFTMDEKERERERDRDRERQREGEEFIRSSRKTPSAMGSFADQVRVGGVGSGRGRLAMSACFANASTRGEANAANTSSNVTGAPPVVSPALDWSIAI